MRSLCVTVSIGCFLHLSGAALAAEKQTITRSAQSLYRQDDSHHLIALSDHLDAQGRRHKRYQQYYEAVPVWGAYVSEHQTIQGNWYAQGLLYHHLKEDLGEKPASFEALLPVLKEVNSRYPKAHFSKKDIQPMVYVDDNDRAHWAYRILIKLEIKHSRPQKLSLIVDAVTGKIYKTWDTINTLEKIEGLGFGGNARIGKFEYGHDKPALSLVRNESKSICLMQNEFVSVEDMHSQYFGRSPVASFDCEQSQTVYWTGENQDGYDEINQAYSPINDALYIGTIIHQFFSDWYHVDALGGTEKDPKRLIMRVHYGKSYENAFWDGRQMSFGDGAKSMYPLVVLSVAAHEIAHGFTDHHSDLYYTEQSGAINESFSDMAAQAVEYYVQGESSWMIAHDVMKDSKKVLRNMRDPASDGKSINHVRDYYNGLDVHYASGVYNRFFYLLANTSSWNTRKAFDVVLKANVDYWTPTSNYEDAACGVMWAAEDLSYSVSDVRTAFKKVGIEGKKCGV